MPWGTKAVNSKGKAAAVRKPGKTRWMLAAAVSLGVTGPVMLPAAAAARVAIRSVVCAVGLAKGCK